MTAVRISRADAHFSDWSGLLGLLHEAFAYMESRIDPMIASVATMVVLLAAAATLFVDRVLRIRLID